MKSLFNLKIILVPIILLFALLISFFLIVTKPEARKRSQIRTLPTVQVIPITSDTHRFAFESQGFIKSNKVTKLSSEVSGKVIKVSSKYEEGEKIKKNEVLLQIDPTNYKYLVSQSKSLLADAKAKLQVENQLASQSLSDWRKYGNKNVKPSDLVLRIPQKESAEAKVKAAEYSLIKAKKDLERTYIRSPFDGIISKKFVQFGDFLSPGKVVAELFDYLVYKIELPISLEKSNFLEKNNSGHFSGKVELFTQVSGKNYKWDSKIFRSKSQIDALTSQVVLVVQVNSNNESDLLQPGLFLNAKIYGKEFNNIIKIPFKSLKGLSKVVVIDKDSKIRFREVRILNQNNNTVFVRSENFKQGDRLCITDVSGMEEGILVKGINK